MTLNRFVSNYNSSPKLGEVSLSDGGVCKNEHDK